MKCQVITAVRPAVDAECSFLLAGTGAQQQLAYSVFFEFPVFLAEPLSSAGSLSDKTS